MVKSPVRSGVMEKVTVTVEVIWPLMMLTFWEFPDCTIRKPVTCGVGRFLAWPPSKASDIVAVSPMVIRSRSSDAVKLAASAVAARKINAAKK